MKHIIFLQRAGLAAAVILFTAGAARAQLAAQPGSLTFHTTGQPQIIALSHNGQPLPASAITGHKIYINENDYDEFFTYGQADGQFSIAANDLTETGTYKLILSTPHGPIAIDIVAPLDEAPWSIEQQAKALGITVDALMTRLGLYTLTGRENVSFTLPATYYDGQTLTLAMPATEGRTCVWRVNGNVVAEGPDAFTLKHTFTQPGVQVVEYVEKKGEAIVASAIGNTTVSADAPTTLISAAPNATVTIQAPEGYEQHIWKSNGETLAEGKTFNQMFKTAGKYLVVLESSRPLVEGQPETRQLTYTVNITAR